MYRRMLSIALALGFFTAGSGAASAECASPIDVCHHIGYCIFDNLTDKNKVDRDRILDAISRSDGASIYAGAEACQRNVGSIKDWEKHSAGCNDNDYLNIGRFLTGTQNKQACGKRERWYCVISATGEVLGDMKPEGICDGPKSDSSICSCPRGRGQVRVHRF